MAGRKHAEDCVIERRLRPIYEWLDSGTNKKAVQEADKVLRKQPSLHCARVLKGLALLRMGRREECLALVGQVVKEAPCDETTLQALTICYREMHQPEQICRVYEVAVKSEPSNEELLSHLFMSYVRVGDYKNQQHTAMKLYKLRPKNPYYFWAVMSHVMQAHKSVDPKGKEVSLLLAERMVNNFVKNGKIEAEAEVMTYLHILETQGKYVEALAVLDGPLAAKVIHQPENFLALHRGKYHTRLGQFAAAAAVYRDLIQREPDNWQHYIEYINSIINTTTTTTTTSTADDPSVEASRFLTGVKEKAVEENSKDRGPLLGLLQLARVLKDSGKEDRIEELCGDPSDLLLTYIKVYGDKMCCYGDIVNFLPLISEERATGLLERVRNLSRVTAAGVPVDVEAVHRDLCWHQLRRALGQQEALTAEQHQSFANTLVHRYTATQNLAANMADTDIRPEDAYLILAAHSYLKAIQLASHSPSPPPANPGEGEAGGGARGVRGECVHPPTLIFRLAAILERGVERTKANFQLKLVLIKVYNMLGATGAARSVYERCDMKHIQLDTLGHVLALQALDTASYTTANAIFSATLKFFMANYKDTSDPLIASYKYGSLTRIPEFVEFRERLSNSLHFATVTAEHMLFDLTTDVNSHSQVLEAVGQMDISPATDRTDWDDLRDNRDLRVMNTWDPPHSCLKEEDIAASVAADTALLRLRNLTLRLVGAACTLCPPTPQNNSVAAANKENSECVNGEGGGGGGGGSSIYDKLTDRLQEEYQDVYDRYANATPLKLPLQGPDTPRLHLYLKGSYLPLVLCHAKVLQKVYSYSLDPTGPDTKTIETVKEAREQSEAILHSHHQFITGLQTTPLDITPGTNPPALAHLHHLAQTVGVAAILLGCCVVLLKPIKTQLAKRGKKRKEAVVMPEVIPQLSSYLSSLTTHLQRLEKALVAKHKQTNANSTQEATSRISASLIGTKGLDKSSHVCGKVKEPKEVTESGSLQGVKQLECQRESDKGQDSMVAGPDGLPDAEGLGDVCHKVQESLARSLARLGCTFECKIRYLNSLKL